MLKGNQTILRLMMALAIAFGVEATASAQLGGLLKKAKQSVTDKVKKTVSDTKEEATTSVRQQVEQTAEETVGSATGEVGGEWEWENQHPENNDRVDYSIARQTDWTVESDINDICADLAWNLKNIYKLENYLNVMRHYPAYNEVLKARLQGISGLGHVQGRSTLSDAVSDPVQKKLIDDWMSELSSAHGRLAAAYIPDGFGIYADANQVYKEWREAVEEIEDKSSVMDKIEAFTIAYNKLEFAIITNKIKGTEGSFQTLFGQMKAGYNLLPDWARKYYADEISYDAIKKQALERKADAVAIKRAGQEAHAKGDAEYRRKQLETMYKEAKAQGRYKSMPASKGSQMEQYVKSYIEKTYPEWGKVVRVACAEQWNVVRDKLGNIQYRYCGASILCEDMGYKVIHGVDVNQTYSSGKYEGALVRNDAWNSLIDLAK